MAQKRNVLEDDYIDDQIERGPGYKACQTEQFLEGRCVLSSNVTMKFFNTREEKPKKGELGKNESKDGHNLHIFFQQYESKPFKKEFYVDKFEHLLSRKTLSGVLYLETFVSHMCYESKTQLVGVLFFACPPKQRDKYIQDGVIPHNDVWSPMLEKNNPVLIIPASQLIVTGLKTLPTEFKMRDIKEYRASLKYMIDTPSKLAGVKTLINALDGSGSCFLNSWPYPALMDIWSFNHNVRCASDPPKRENEDDGMRNLQIHEFFYLFFVINLRFPRKNFPDAYNFKNCLRYVRVSAPPTEEEGELSELYVGANFNDHIFRVFNRLGRFYPKVIEEAMRAYEVNCVNHYESLRIAGGMTAALERKTRNYNPFPLFISLKINKLRVGSISCAPTTTLDKRAIRQWSEARNDIVEKEINDVTVYRNVFDEIKAVVADDMPLRLYAKTGNFSVAYASKFNTGEYASGVLNPPESMSGQFVNFKMPYDDPDVCQTGMDRAVCYASFHSTPIWQRQFSTVNEYGEREDENIFVVVSETSQGITSEQLYKGMLAPKKKNHEIVSSEFHVSTLVIDIDLNPAIPMPNMDILRLCEDCVTLADMVLKNMPVFEGSKHYVYFSDPRESIPPKKITGVKFGLHHHISFPDGVVMQTQAASTFIKILSEVRYIFKDTIGVFCGEKDGEVYDQKIYGKPKNTTAANMAACLEEDECGVGKITHHPIRLPGMYKRDDSNQLVLKYSTDENPPSIYSKLVHGPMKADVGKVVTKIVNSRPINDEQYINHLGSKRMNRYVEEACKSGGVSLINEVNSKCLLYVVQENEEYSLNDRYRMAGLINTLWEDTGKAAMRMRLEVIKHSENSTCYSPMDISTAMEDSKVIYSASRDKFLLVSGIREQEEKFFICPKRVHTRPHTEKGVVVEVFTQANMVRFGLCISRETFKRCSGSYVQDVSAGLVYNHTCLFQTVAQSLASEIDKYNVNGVDIMTVCKCGRVDKEMMGDEAELTLVCEEEEIDYEDHIYDFAELPLTDHDRPLDDVSPNVDCVQYLYAHYRNERGQLVSVYRSMSNKIVMLASDKDGLMQAFACVNSTMFVEALRWEYMQNFIDIKRVDEIATIMREMDGQTVEVVNAQKAYMEEANDEEEGLVGEGEAKLKN
ncbi:ORF41 [Haliotid herpesvirus 1]|uniref:Uncharacterized protein n=1 Tax=Abalone herpesvirus Taiwan/2005 TaxID=1821058 RepID=A0A143DI92_9VIRU|nr:hypothetical protein tc2005_p086c [Abalone herpesvirus Taiwan/2005]UCX57032.1 ORF41 [Haliotid herpesvirus 1]